MAVPSHFMGQDGFIWFVGVVEDRNDPEKIGRVRVRCLGYHTENLESLSTANLPWAHVMHPVTGPSMHGLGNTPSFLVEGSWVIGFFRDSLEKQQPIIIGSLPGIPYAEADPTKGFNDPRSKESKQEIYRATPKYGPYPGEISHSGHSVGETDTSRLAQGKMSETHSSLKTRRDMKQTDVPKAQMPWIPTVEDNPGTEDEIDDETFKVREKRTYWDEPNPKGIEKSANPYISAKYPFNHVYESESGHIHEVDDSPGAERLLTQHHAGGFEEIHAEGTKVVKVIGDNYEIIAGDSNVYINGNVNLTIKGTKRELIQGDYVLEVEGNYTRKIHKSERVKIGAGPAGGNLETEIKGNFAYNIDDDVKGRIGRDVDIEIDRNESRTVNGYFDNIVSGDYTILNYGAKGVAIGATQNISATTTSGIVSFKSGSKLNIKSKTAMTINSETSITETASTFIEEESGSTFQSTAGTVYQIHSGGGSPTATNRVDINPA